MKYTDNDLSLLFLKNSPLERQKKEEDIKSKVKDKINECLANNLEQYKDSPLLVEVVACLVEKYTPPGNRFEKAKLDKKNLVLEIFMELFPGSISPTDLKKLEDLIDFLCHSKLIKRLNSVSKFFLRWLFLVKKIF
jgi:hypothetical protein